MDKENMKFVSNAKSHKLSKSLRTKGTLWMVVGVVLMVFTAIINIAIIAAFNLFAYEILGTGDVAVQIGVSVVWVILAVITLFMIFLTYSTVSALIKGEAEKLEYFYLNTNRMISNAAASTKTETLTTSETTTDTTTL